MNVPAPRCLPPGTRPVLEADVLELAPRLRAEDVAELAAASDETPETGLRSALARSWCACTVLDPDGYTLAVAGVARHSSVAWLDMVWLLGADVPPRAARGYLATTRLVLEAFAVPGRTLAALVDRRHEKALRWLAWLGFHVVRELPHYGAAGLPFVVVAWRRDTHGRSGRRDRGSPRGRLQPGQEGARVR